MAYNQIPKTAAEMRKMSKHLKHAKEARRVYDYCVKAEPSIKDPIAMDSKDANLIKIIRELKGVITIDEIKKGAKIEKLKLDSKTWGNGTRGGGGANNQGSAFERKLAEVLGKWIAESTYPNDEYGTMIKGIVEDHALEDCKAIKVEMVGEKDTKRPLTFKGGGWMVGTAGAGKYDIGEKVSDVTLDLKCSDGSNRKVYISAKTSGTVALSNLGTKTNVFPEKQILEGKITTQAGKQLMKTFGIKEADMVKIFQEARQQHKEGKSKIKVKSGYTDNNVSINPLLKGLIQGCLGYGYHYVHKHSGGIKSFNMTKKINEATAQAKKLDVYYGGKTNLGQRIDMVVDTPTMELKFNIRDTSGKGEGIPDKFQAGYKFKDESEWSLGDGEELDE
mgnify:CR=1 FL=1